MNSREKINEKFSDILKTLVIITSLFPTVNVIKYTKIFNAVMYITHGVLKRHFLKIF